MSTAAITYTFSPNTTILSDEANTNFQDLVDFLNSDVMHRDASAAFTAIPSGPSSDPSTADQLVRKQYVDRRAPKMFGRSGTAIEGTPPAIGTGEFLIQVGRNTVTSAADGSVTINLPSAFSTGLIGVQVTTERGAAERILQVDADACTTSVLAFVLRNTTTGGLSASYGPFSCYWVAWGW